MSEFEKLMAGKTKRSDIQKRNARRDQNWATWRWVLLASFVFTLIPPHIGVIVLVPTLGIGMAIALTEWVG